jgi:hypothetical protein
MKTMPQSKYRGQSQPETLVRITNSDRSRRWIATVACAPCIEKLGLRLLHVPRLNVNQVDLPWRARANF